MQAKTIIYRGIELQKASGELFTDEEAQAADKDEKARIEDMEYWAKYLSIMGRHANPIIQDLTLKECGPPTKVKVRTKLP